MQSNPFNLPFTNRRYLDALLDHIVLFDGATGTQLAKHALTAADFGGERAEGLMEMLLFHRPELVAGVHAAYFKAGAEVVKTNSFRANRLTLAEFGAEALAPEIPRAAAKLAREVADRVSAGTGIPRLVAGSMGPTGKLPSLDAPELADIAFAELVEIHAEYAEGLVAGGVDLLLLETHQDLLELKAAIQGIWRAFEKLNARIPIQAQVTLDASGHMLTGPDADAALVTLAALPVDVLGLNCSTGPEEMRAAVQRLLALSNRPLSVMPNAGMPRNVAGRAVYAMQPEPFAATLLEFVRWGARAVGGCCGTGPEHIAALRAALDAAEVQTATFPASGPLPYVPGPLPYVAGPIQATALAQTPRPLLVGERINTQGSRKARELVLDERYDALLELAEAQVEYGAHVLDVCLALTERGDEAATMARVVKLLALNTPAPLVIDTTDIAVMRAALETYPGRAIINSVHLEAGEARAREILTLARDFGAALIALTIDEAGMAKTAARKLDVARRFYHLAVDDIGLPAHALIFDLLTFTLATGDPEAADTAGETLAALRDIKTALPGVLTNLGVSNVSYGLRPPARRVLNSVFLYEAVEAGLDVAIVNPAQITPYPDIPAEARELAEDLLANRQPDALARFIAHFEGAVDTATAPGDGGVELTPSEVLFAAITRRRREGVESLVDACLETQAPVEVLNDILLPAMKEVGQKFGAGELILPFVLKSAEVMKAAVAHLEQYLDQAEGAQKGVVVLATVFGDVHDIGKNLVKTILANNGYTVHDLGKQVPVDVVIDKAVEVNADAIGLSALLVATSQQMARAVETLQRRELALPLLIGGAAINPEFAQRIAIPEGGTLYKGGVYYCEDAFEALQVLEHIVLHEPTAPPEHHHAHEPAPNQPEACASCGTPCDLPAAELAHIPDAPFWGTRVVRGIALADLLPLLDRNRLFRLNWGAKGAKGKQWEKLEAEFEARLAEMWATAGEYLRPQAVYGYFPAQSDGDDLILYDPEAPETLKEIARFSFPRQSAEQNSRSGRCLCLADYFAPVGNGVLDVAPFQVVTVGAEAGERFGALDAAGEYSEAYFVHGLAAQVAEAAAEWMHRRIRRELGIADDQGKRYSWGYPACPDVGQHHTLFHLLPAESALGMALTEVGQLVPEHSTAALVVHHPEAKYFVVR